jgi:NTP pyrophosphatase (non-canonical NTP hydrolase)
VYDEPSEALLTHWNEHNDHADGTDRPDDETAELADTSQDCGPGLFAAVTAITAWLDNANPADPHEDCMRVLKLVEEAGEAAAAYIGMVGQNPRKGVTHTREDLLNELADVAITALCAIQHFTQDPDETRDVVMAKTAGIIARVPQLTAVGPAQVAAPTPTYSPKPHDPADWCPTCHVHLFFHDADCRTADLP